MTSPDNLLLAQAAPAAGTTGQPVPGSSLSSTTEVPSTPAAVGQPGQPSPLTGMLLPLGLLVLLYFVMIRPQTKKEKTRQKQIKELAKNDKVLTRGGIYGIVSAIRQEEGVASIKISENVKVEISLQAIETVNPQKESAK